MSKRLISILPIFLALALPALAQTEAATGVIGGAVMDQNGAVIAQVVVNIENIDKGMKRATVTNEQGLYRASLLPLGNYVVRFEFPGFGRLERTGIRLGVGQQLTIDGTLKPASVSESVSVVADAPPIETNRYERTQVIRRPSVTCPSMGATSATLPCCRPRWRSAPRRTASRYRWVAEVA